MEEKENGSPQMTAASLPASTGRPSVAPKHVTLPLIVDHKFNVYGDNTLGTLIARCGGDGFEYTGWTEEECTAAAAFLAHAANCHHDLLEALEQCAEALAFARDKLGYCGEGDGQDRKGDGTDPTGSLYALQSAHAAIAKAQLRAASDAVDGLPTRTSGENRE